MILTPKSNSNSSSSLPECPPTPQVSERPKLLLLKHSTFPELPFQFNTSGGDIQNTQSRRVSEVTNNSRASSLFKSTESNQEVPKIKDSTSYVKDFGWPKQHYARIKGLSVSKMAMPKAAWIEIGATQWTKIFACIVQNNLNLFENLTSESKLKLDAMMYLRKAITTTII